MASESLGPEERERLMEAASLHAPLERAARLGLANGMGYAVFGVLTMLFSLDGPDLVGLSLGAVLLAVGLLERREAGRLRVGDEGAPARLARGELVLLVAISVYCVLRLTLLREDTSELERLGGGDALGMDIGAMMESLNTMVFATFLAVTLLYQGGMARYFLRCRAKVAAYLEGAPEWARQVVEQMER